MTKIASLLKKWKRLHQNKKVILQTNEEVLTDSLHMTSITTPEAFQLETRNTSNTGSLFLNSKRKTEHQGHTNKNNTQDLFFRKKPILNQLHKTYFLQITPFKYRVPERDTEAKRGRRNN